jgi:hypothetical protein
LQIAVLKLIQQTLYQLGEFSDGEFPTLASKADIFFNCCTSWSPFQEALTLIADELKTKPREHRSLVLLGQVASYAGQWDSNSREAARKFSALARFWADNLKISIHCMDSGTESEQLALATAQSKCCLFYMYAIGCHGVGDLSSPDLQDLCELSILAENCRLYEEKTDHEQDVRDLTVVSHGILGARLAELLCYVSQHDQSLTKAVRLVLPHQTPETLEWTQMCVHGVASCCFEAVSSDHKDHFSVNLLTGSVLFNGMPPSRLPILILQSPMYVRSFSNRNFEVVLLSSAKLQTTRQVVHGFKYNFFFTECKSLVIEEIEVDTGLVLELLDGTPSNIQHWGKELPIRLKVMHSHWYCRRLQIIVLRPMYFKERAVSFILKSECCNHHADDSAEVTEPEEDDSMVTIPRWSTMVWMCFSVPEHRQSVPWQELQEDISFMDRLVLHSCSNVLNILREFEPGESLVHFYLAADKAHKCDLQRSVLFELPRFDLSFELINYKMKSRNFLGFHLAKCQQLDNVLLDFRQYLILEHIDGKQYKVIMPVGIVTRAKDTVFIAGSGSCDADRHMHAYDIHPRFKTIEASCIEARLQLAALFAATGSLLPELGTHVTGGEVALELVRQSWVNCPLTTAEQEQLDSIILFDQQYPSLSLLCEGLRLSSLKTSFLYTSTSNVERLNLFSEMHADAVTEYIQLKQTGRLNCRMLLSSIEETECIGREIFVSPGELRFQHELRFQVFDSKELSCSSRETFIHSVEEKLNSLLKLDAPGISDHGENIPLDAKIPIGKSKLGVLLLEQLQLSWNAHNEIEAVCLDKSLEEARSFLEVLISLLLHERRKLEGDLIDAIEWIQFRPAEQTQHSIMERVVRTKMGLRKIGNLIPSLTIRDLASSACTPTELRGFNPFLSKSSMATLRLGILQWLQLCVLEDTLQRMHSLAVQGNEPSLVSELQETERTWSVQEYPQWLVFEVEQQLQIRKIQVVVAQHLIRNPASIAQLNMGEGKTRVILPMLVLHLGQCGYLVRLHVLLPLLGEFYHYIHRRLTASLLQVRIFLLPFYRDVQLDDINAKKMLECLVRCKRSRGVILVASEHRLSLDLKWHELRLASRENESLTSLLLSINELQFFEVLDES